MTNSSKDVWDKLGTVGILFSGILIPLAIALTGNYVSEKIKESEIELKYVEIATSLIRDEPRSQNAALRSWAVDVLAKNAKTVPLSPEAQAELKNSRFPIYSTGTTSGYDLTSYTNPNIDVVGTDCQVDGKKCAAKK